MRAVKPTGNKPKDGDSNKSCSKRIDHAECEWSPVKAYILMYARGDGTNRINKRLESARNTKGIKTARATIMAGG